MSDRMEELLAALALEGFELPYAARARDHADAEQLRAADEQAHQDNLAALRRALAGWEVLSPGRRAAKAQFDTAVNWMANRLDLDEVDQFQALADGLVTEAELGELSMDEIRARLAAAAEGS